jgi:molybdopterin converting factor subunit 1
MRVTIRLFARLRDLVGATELEQVLPDGATVAEAWSRLVADHPAAAPYEASMSCAVNADYARMSAPLRDGDEVAFLPPVSGG